MASKKKYDAVATIGEYTNGQGETKKRYQNVGTVFENDDGKLSLKLDAIPVGPGWSGYISFYDPKPRDGHQQSSPPAQREAPRNHSIPSERAKGQAPADDDFEDIPF